MPKHIRTYILFALGVVVIGVLLLVLLAYPNSKSPVVQPINYSHKVHIETAGATCTDCHLNVETMPVTTIPGREICETCHSDAPLSNSPAEKKLLEYIAEKKDIPWIQVNAVPDHVYFSHRRHVTIGGLECATCHGDVASMTSPIVAAAIPMTMENCLNCHKEHKVTTDCIYCHR